MNRFSMWLANMMRGRYGMDQFNRFLLIVALILIVLNTFLRMRWIHLLEVFVLIYIYCRMFSRNYANRSRENQKYLEITSGIRHKFQRRSAPQYDGSWSNKNGTTFHTVKDKSKKILRCPGCGEKMRVPKGVGKIRISCPHCGTKFEKKV